MKEISAVDYLNSFINYELVDKQSFPREFHLLRVEKLLTLIGNPHKKLKCIHIAGSKGKGSTATLIANILKFADYKVGLYTSPHIYTMNERIVIFDGKKGTSNIFKNAISENELLECINDIRDSIEAVRSDKSLGRLSFFEVFTVIGLYFFAKQNVDFAVVETGLGGRLDATNVVDSVIAIITSIGYEHTHVLGNDIADIAREKAAIIKTQGQGVIVARQEEAVNGVISERCNSLNCEPIWIDKNYSTLVTNKSLNAQTFVVKSEENCKPFCTKLVGEHQIENVCNALAAVELLKDYGYSIDDKDVDAGISNAEWPIRFEVLGVEPPIILDAAHTGESIKCLVKTLQDIVPDKEIKVIFGLSDDKDLGKISQSLSGLKSEMILTQANHLRARKFTQEDNQKYFNGCAILSSTVDEAIRMAFKSLKKEDVLVVTGSVFVASEARKILMKENKYVSI